MGPLSGATDAYGYNGRNEVVSARRTLGGGSNCSSRSERLNIILGNRQRIC